MTIPPGVCHPARRAIKVHTEEVRCSRLRGEIGGQDEGREGSRRCFLLGTIWGPHVLRGGEQAACRSLTRTTLALGLTSRYPYSYVLGVKGSQVRILSSRRS